MSLDIIENNLEEIYPQYHNARENKNKLPHNPLFLPVHEIVSKLGLEERIHHIHTNTIEMKGRIEREYTRNRIIDAYEPKNGLLDENLMERRSLDDSIDLKNCVFEYKDTLYINEDQEIQKEVERFNRNGLGKPLNVKDEDSFSDLLNASEMVQRNREFLDELEEQTTSNEDKEDLSYKLGKLSSINKGGSLCTPPDKNRDEECSNSEETETRIGMEFKKLWFFEVIDELKLKEWTTKFCTGVVFDVILNNLLSVFDPTMRSYLGKSASQKKLSGSVKKLDKEDYYYKADEQTCRVIQEKNRSFKQNIAKVNPKSANTISDFNPDYEKDGKLDQQKSPSPINNITESFENQVNTGRGKTEPRNSEIGVSIENDITIKQKAVSTKKGKKAKKGNILIEENEEQSLFSQPKAKKSKGKKGQKNISQNKIALNVKTKEEMHYIDGVSEIPNRSIDESMNNDGEFEDFNNFILNTNGGPLNNKVNEMLNSTHTTPFVTSELLDGNNYMTDKKDSPSKTSENNIDQGSDVGQDGKDKKKKKKKAKKAAAKQVNNSKDLIAEETCPIDKEKDTMISEIDKILRKSDNLLSIFEVLDNNFMPEEIYVDKRRHYTKYVYISDISVKGGK